MDEIQFAATFAEIRIDICQNVKDFLNGVVQNKLKHSQELITKKQKQPKDKTILEIFEQKIANALVNTSESNKKEGLQSPIYNMRVTDSQFRLKTLKKGLKFDGRQKSLVFIFKFDGRQKKLLI